MSRKPLPGPIPPRGPRARPTPRAPHNLPAPPAPRPTWWDGPLGSKIRPFYMAVEVVLWVSSGVCIVATRGEELCIALVLAAMALGIVRALTERRRRY